MNERFRFAAAAVWRVTVSSYMWPNNCSTDCDVREWNKQQEGLAVASIARDDPSTLPGDDPFLRAHWTINSSVLAPACTATAMRGKLGSEFET